MGPAPIAAQDVQAALAEITSQTTEQIEGATAVKWGARALAAWQLAQQPGGGIDLHWFREATSYKHEALEHAAWGPIGLLDRIRAQLVGVP